jgi:hypothetical protein
MSDPRAPYVLTESDHDGIPFSLLTILVQQTPDGRYLATFDAATPIGRTSGTNGRPQASAFAAVGDLLEQLTRLADDPTVSGLLLAQVARRLRGPTAAPAPGPGPEGHP